MAPPTVSWLNTLATGVSGHRRHSRRGRGSAMSKARLVITALFVDHQSPAEVAARYGVHRAWVYKLKARYDAEGEAALEPRSRRPKSSPRATPSASVDLVLSLHKQLGEAGLDAGADTIGWHLSHHHA